MSKHMVWVGLLMVLLMGCSETTDELVKDSVKEEVDHDAIRKELSTYEKEQKLLDIYREEMGDIHEVTLNEKVYIFKPIDLNYTRVIMDLLEGKRSLDEWNKLVGDYQRLSDSMASVLGSNYSFVLAHPTEGYSLLSIMGGVILLDELNPSNRDEDLTN